jgi:hypothetical protein
VDDPHDQQFFLGADSTSHRRDYQALRAIFAAIFEMFSRNNIKNLPGVRPLVRDKGRNTQARRFMVWVIFDLGS